MTMRIVVLWTTVLARLTTLRQAVQVRHSLSTANLGPRWASMFLPWKPWPILQMCLKLLMMRCPRHSLGVMCRHTARLSVPRRAMKGCVAVLFGTGRTTGALILMKLCDGLLRKLWTWVMTVVCRWNICCVLGPTMRLMQCRWQCRLMLDSLRYPLGRGCSVPISRCSEAVPSESLLAPACTSMFLVLMTLLTLKFPKVLQVLLSVLCDRHSRTCLSLLRTAVKVVPFTMCPNRTWLVTCVGCVSVLSVLAS